MVEPLSARFGLGRWEVDLGVGSAVAADDTVTLTPMECRLLGRLRAARGAPVAREALLREVWEYASTVRSRTVDTTLRRLRMKLEVDPDTPTLLLTHRGEGITLLGVRASQPMASPRRLVRRPVAPTLVGRERDVTRVLTALERGRLTTLVGPPGVGKTALAEVVVDRWADGGRAAIFVSVAGLVTADAVERAIRRVVDGARGDGDVAALLEGLDDPLVVLDGADDLASVAAEEIAGIVRSAAVLVTRQSALACRGAGRIAVAPLEEVDAGALVEDLARARDVDLDLETVARIARAAGGLPLAIRLAVPVALVAGVDALEEPAWHRVALQGEPDPHHDTLHGALARSLRSLDDRAGALLVRLTVFTGAFDHHAVGALDDDALGPLLRLHERGLVHGRGEMRLLAPIRLHLGPPPTDALAARDRWLVALGDQDLLTVAAARRHLLDLVDAIGRAGSDAGALAWTLLGAGRIVGIGPDVLDALRLAGATRPDEPWVRGALAGALYFRWGPTAEVEALADGLGGAPGAWLRVLIARDPEALDEAVVAGGSAIRASRMPAARRAAMLTDVYGRDPDPQRSVWALRQLRGEARDAPVLRLRLAGVLAMAELRVDRTAAARALLDEVDGRDEPMWSVISGMTALMEERPEQALAAFTRGAEGFATLGDLHGMASALAYRDLAAFWLGAPLLGHPGPPLRPGPESLRRFLADPLGVAIDALPEPSARDLIGAWRAGAPLPPPARSWPVRLLGRVLSQRAADRGVGR